MPGLSSAERGFQSAHDDRGMEFTRPQVGQMLLQNGKFEDVDAKKMIGVISRTLNEHVFTVGQKFAIEFCGNNYLVTVGGISSDVISYG